MSDEIQITPTAVTNKRNDVSGLSERQERFVEAYIENGGNASEAIQEAGYNGDNAKIVAHAALKSKRVQNALLLHMSHALTVKDAVVARKVMTDIMNDIKAPVKERRIIATWILEHAGMGAVNRPKNEAAVNMDKPLHEMTLADLQAVVEAGKAIVNTIDMQTINEE